MQLKNIGLEEPGTLQLARALTECESLVLLDLSHNDLGLCGLKFLLCPMMDATEEPYLRELKILYLNETFGQTAGERKLENKSADPNW